MLNEQDLGCKNLLRLDRNGFVDLSRGGIIRAPSVLRVQGHIGSYGHLEITSWDKALFFNSTSKSTEIDFVIQGPIQVVFCGLLSPDWQLYANAIKD